MIRGQAVFLCFLKGPKPSVENPNAISLGSEKNHIGSSSSLIVTSVWKSGHETGKKPTTGPDLN